MTLTISNVTPHLLKYFTAGATSLFFIHNQVFYLLFKEIKQSRVTVAVRHLKWSQQVTLEVTLTEAWMRCHKWYHKLLSRQSLEQQCFSKPQEPLNHNINHKVKNSVNHLTWRTRAPQIPTNHKQLVKLLSFINPGLEMPNGTWFEVLPESVLPKLKF